MAMFFFACKPEFTLQREDFTPVMVVWGYFNPDSLFRVYLSVAQPAWEESTPVLLDGARVVVFENGLPIDTLPQVSNGIYTTTKNKKPVVGHVYHLVVSHPDFPELSTTPDTLPDIPELLAIQSWTENLPNNNTGQVLAGIDVSIRRIAPIGHIGHTIYFPELDSEAYFSPPEGFTCQSQIVEIEFVSFSDYSCRITDEINYKITSSNYRPTELTEAYVSICFASEPTITFGKQLGRFHDLNTGVFGVDPFFEPIFLPQNTINGYGFVGSYSCKTVIVNF